jgi:hypothetical protein
MSIVADLIASGAGAFVLVHFHFSEHVVMSMVADLIASGAGACGLARQSMQGVATLQSSSFLGSARQHDHSLS